VQAVRKIDHIVLHHSASPLATTAKDIEQWHLAKNWSGTGYHIICEASGKLVLGRPIGKTGAHAKGWNRSSIGICLVGDNTDPMEEWTKMQVVSLGEMYRVLSAIFPDALWLGHRDLPGAATECPGLDVKKLISRFAFENKGDPQSVV
jgi:hypothetical protein